MPYDALCRAVPDLPAALDDLAALHDDEAIWPLLRRLLEAPAPSGGANLPGGVGEVIGALASELGLGANWIPELGETGNAALSLGADGPPTLIAVAHMDRPSFRVRSPESGALFPICANRFPQGEYRTGAKALRFADGRLVVGAQGAIVSRRQNGRDTLAFEATDGALAWQDTVVMAVEPVLGADGTVTATGLDNALGVLTALLAASALARVERALTARGVRLLVVFTDQEEGPPEAFFGHGAARLAHAVPAPRGVVVVDAHGGGEPDGPTLGAGAAHGFVSGWGRGSIVPPNAQALALDLAAGVNRARAGTVQFDTGYLSRSDDMALERWAKVMALIGPPMLHAHTGDETARLADVRSSAIWLAWFLAAGLALSPVIGARYALTR